MEYTCRAFERQNDLDLTYFYFFFVSIRLLSNSKMVSIIERDVHVEKYTLNISVILILFLFYTSISDLLF